MSLLLYKRGKKPYLMTRPFSPSLAVRSVGGLSLVITDTVGKASPLQLYTNRGATWSNGVQFVAWGQGEAEAVTPSHKGKEVSSATVWLMEQLHKGFLTPKEGKSVLLVSLEVLFNWHLVSACLNINHVFNLYPPKSVHCFCWQRISDHHLSLKWVGYILQ